MVGFRPIFALATLLVVLPGAARAACPRPTRSGDLIRPLGEAQAAFATMDGGAFADADRRAADALTCLGEPITAAVAASWHRQAAFSAWLRDDVDGTRSSFRAALALQPDWRLPEDVAPPDNPLSRLYLEAGALGPGPDRPVWVDRGRALLVDGSLASALPQERPAIVQVVSAEGVVLRTLCLSPDQAPPPEVHLGAPPPELESTLTFNAGQEDPPLVEPGARRPGRALALGAAGALLLSGGMYAWSGITHARYVGEGLVPDDDLDALVRANHVQVWTAAGLAAASLGLGVGAAVSW
jgi:hypothetical protein